MTEDERRLIDDLFDRLAQAERQAPYRERDVEQLIAGRLARQPGAAYYLSQLVLVQEHALREAKMRMDDMEDQLSRTQQPQGQPQPQSGGFLGGLFGGGSTSRTPSVPATGGSYGSGSYGSGGGGGYGGRMSPEEQARADAFRQGAMQQQRGGGGFLGGAAQMAVGVMGGVIAGSLIADMIGGNDAAAAAPAAPEAIQSGGEEEVSSGGFDSDDFGGDF